MKVKELVQLYKDEKVQNTRVDPHAVEDFLAKNIKITQYTTFMTKKEIAESIIESSIKIIDGYKVVDSPSQFLSFVISMLIVHTDLIIEDPFEDYDALCEVGLLQLIINMFEQDYKECETVLKMIVNDELQTNTTPAIIAQFLDRISKNIGDFSSLLKEKVGELDIGKMLSGDDVNTENIAKILGVLNMEK